MHANHIASLEEELDQQHVAGRAEKGTPNAQGSFDEERRPVANSESGSAAAATLAVWSHQPHLLGSQGGGVLLWTKHPP